MVEELIPLFPLNVVLFPGSSLPLHIFEHRYRVLIRECLEQSGMEFGINFVDGEKLSLVGCAARVREVVKRYDDGRCDVIVDGSRRYKLSNIEKDKAPYDVGQVTFFSEETDAVDMDLLLETTGLYNHLVRVVRENWPHHFPATAVSPMVSFVMAQKIGMSLRERQQLLEMHAENERLRRIQSYLSDVLPRLKYSQEIQRIISNDGYITNS